MRRKLAIAAAALVILAGGSVALITWMTGPGPDIAVSAPPASAAPVPLPLPLLPAPGGFVPPAPAAQARPQPAAPATFPAGAPQPPGTEVPPLPRRERRQLRSGLGALEPRVLDCANQVRAAPPGSRGRTVLAVEVEVRQGQARVVDVLVHRRGPDSDELVACARGALIGQSFPASGIQDGTEGEVLLPMPVPGDRAGGPRR